jgi:methionyl-tRNA formyltransferase
MAVCQKLAISMQPFRIVFMGTPEFAAECLRVIHASEIEIAAVVTVPDKPAGRGLKFRTSAVKDLASEMNIPLLQPEKLKDSDFLEKLAQFNADLFVVVAFRMLPAEVFEMPPLGTINLHGSLLPQYRGAAPINHAIINGETISGVTTFMIGRGMDTGHIIHKESVGILPDDNAGILHDKLMTTGSHLLLKTIRDLRDQKAEFIPQEQILKEDEVLKPAPKLSRDFCRILWNNKIQEVYNHIRGLSPYPGAWTRLSDGTILKIYECEMIDGRHDSPAGTVISDCKSHIYITTDGGIISLLKIQAEGKKAMKTDEYLRGVKNFHFVNKAE